MKLETCGACKFTGYTGIFIHIAVGRNLGDYYGEEVGEFATLDSMYNIQTSKLIACPECGTIKLEGVNLQC